MRPITLTILALAGAARAAGAQEGIFVLRSGADTVSLERFTREAERLTGDVVVRQAGLRIKFVATFGPDLAVTSLTNQFWAGADASEAPPRQTATITFRGDSAFAEVSSAGQQRVERLATKPGAVPYLNPSFALLELVIGRARAAGGDGTVPVFLVAGGMTVSATVKPVGTDSAVVTLPGGEIRVRVDGSGRIQGGAIPAQRLTLERIGAGAATVALERRDYSAPAGAPYTAEDVTVPTAMGHTLAGTLTLPRNPGGRVPAVVTITGSGSQDRDEAITLFKGYQPFRELADSLGRRGIAVLRMDDRGYGRSGGNAATATTADFAQDIQAGLAYLRTRPEIDPARLGLIGHSEGGVIAPMVAKAEPALAGIVLLAGTAYPGRRILLFQLGNLIRQDTALTARQKDSALALVPARVDSLARSSPWLGFFIGYDPVATAREVRTPVLILNGATDQQVTPDQVPLLERAFKAAGNRDVTARVLPDLNHLFVRDPNGFPGGYTSLPSMALDRATVGLVVEWLVRRLGKPAA